MRYFRNTELTKLHNVSDKAVRNWIDAAQSGKISLDLVEVKGRLYVADSLHNDFMIEELVQKGKKYRNKRSYKEVSPTYPFYDLYSTNQIINIANSLEKYHEIPSQYRYLGRGAVYWNAHLHKFYQAPTTNMLTATIELLRLEKGYFDSLLEHHANVNLVDIGVGNGLAAKDLLEYLHGTGKLKRYIGIDCSENLLDITERNIAEWFKGAITTEKHVRDITCDSFAEILCSDSFGKDASETINIILFLGGTVGNFREPSQALRTIRDSMGKKDILITSDELDNENARSFFGSANLESFKNVFHRNKLLLDLLSIDESSYEIEHVFDEQLKSHLVRARLNLEIGINFKVNDFDKRVELHKGDTILLFRMWEWTSHELTNLYEKNGFSQVRITKLHNQDFVLVVSQVNTFLAHPSQI
jgi:uncharacterized SAM-dependent methyltransferase